MTRRSSIVLRLMLSTACIAVGMGGTAFAASKTSDQGSLVGEIVVTATRQESVISKVPMSIAAETQKSLDDLSIKTPQDLQRLVPSLRITANGATGANISIRGVSSTIGAATTGVYLDDSALQTRNLVGIATGGGVFLPQIFDLQRVEVLKGPQGTLYGGSSEGGTIRFITPTPSLTDYSGYAKGEWNTTYKGSDGYEAGAAVGGPLIRDKVGFRLSAWGRHIGGWIDHVNWRNPSQVIEPDTNSEDQHAYRLSLRFQPSTALTLTPAVYFAQDNINDQNLIYKSIPQYTTVAFGTVVSTGKPVGGSYSLGGAGGVLPAGYTPSHGTGIYTDVPGYLGQNVFIHDAQTYGPVHLGQYDTIVNTFVSDSYVGPLSAEKAPRDSQMLLPSFTVDYDAGPVVAKSVTSYVHDKAHGVLNLTYIETLNTVATAGYSPLTDSSILHDVAQNGVFFGYYNFTAQRKGISEEFRLSSKNPGRLSWTAGFYYNHARTTSSNWAPENRSALQLALLGHPQVFSPAHSAAEIASLDQIGTDQVLKETEIAGYGEANYKLTDKLKATAGVRVTRSTIDYWSHTAGLLLPFPFTAGAPLTGKIEETPVTPKFALSYQANDNDLFYVSAAKGFRAGGIQSQANPVQCAADLAALGITSTPVTYGADSVWSYEGGAKLKLGPARVAASGFYINWDKPQTPYILPSCVFQYTQNIGKAVSEGFDMQGDVHIAEGLNLNFALAYTDAHYAQTVVSKTGAVEKLLVADGQKLTNIPAWQGNIGFKYDFPLNSQINGYLIGNYQYIGKYFNSSGPGTSGYSPDYFTVPAMGYVTARLGATFKNVDASLFVDNMFNEDKLMPNALSGRYNCFNTACTSYGSYYNDVKGSTFRPRTFGVTATYRY